jgi:uncharacterized protein
VPRPKCCRRITGEPACRAFTPVGGPVSPLDRVVLSEDEFEAVRLADFEGLYQEEAAEKMGVSRQTFGRIVGAARAKIASVLVEGRALSIEASEAGITPARMFRCKLCQHTWDTSSGTGRPAECPACQGRSLFRCKDRVGPADAGADCPRRPCRGRPSES